MLIFQGVCWVVPLLRLIIIRIFWGIPISLHLGLLLWRAPTQIHRQFSVQPAGRQKICICVYFSPLKTTMFQWFEPHMLIVFDSKGAFGVGVVQRPAFLKASTSWKLGLSTIRIPVANMGWAPGNVKMTGDDLCLLLFQKINQSKRDPGAIFQDHLGWFNDIIVCINVFRFACWDRIFSSITAIILGSDI